MRSALKYIIEDTSKTKTLINYALYEIISLYQATKPYFFIFLSDWSGWDEENQSAACFFCTSLFGNTDAVYGHMRVCMIWN